MKNQTGFLPHQGKTIENFVRRKFACLTEASKIDIYIDNIDM